MIDYLEDLLEEIVGNIYDESDPIETSDIEKLEDNIFFMDQLTTILDEDGAEEVFAQVLKECFQNLTVVTFSRDVFELLCDQFTVILCSGHYMKDERTFYGPLTLDTLSKLHVQKAFLFSKLNYSVLYFGLYSVVKFLYGFGCCCHSLLLRGFLRGFFLGLLGCIQVNVSQHFGTVNFFHFNLDHLRLLLLLGRA